MSLQPTAGWIVRRTILTVIFWIVALSILLYMAGLRVNWRTGTVRGTSSIYIELAGKAKEPIEYILNGESTAATTPVTISQLTPGAYTLTVRQPDHQEWHRSFRLEAGEAANFTAILLIPTLVSPREATEAERKITDGPLVIADEGLRVNNAELYLKDRRDKEELLLRLSEPISQAIWMPDQAHILILAGQTVAIVEKTGTNITPLFIVSSGLSNRLYVNKNGATVLLVSGSAVTAYDIADAPGSLWSLL